MTISTSHIPGVTASHLNQIVSLIGNLPGGPRGFKAAVERWVSVINDLFGEQSVPLTLSNESGSDMDAGDLVYVSGVDANGVSSVTLADADSIGKPAQYVLIEDIANGATGSGAAVYELSGLDTSALLVDDLVYLSATAGGWTKTKPSGAGQTVQRVGVVVTAATNGTIRFYPGMTLLEGVGTDALQAGTLAASVAGRALMATGYFTSAKALDAFAADSIANAFLLQAVANGAFVADDATRALFAANFLGATAVGRALMQTGFFDATKALDAFAAKAIALSRLADITDGATWYTADTVQGIADAVVAAVGGTNQGTRVFSGGSPSGGFNNADLTTAVATVLATMQESLANLVMENGTPSSTSSRGLVITGLTATEQTVPDMTIRVAGGACIGHDGKFHNPGADNNLAITAADGANPRIDVVVVTASNAIAVRTGVAAAIPVEAALTLGDVPLYTVAVGAGVVTILNADLTLVQQTTASIDPSRLLPATTADLLALLATDQITAAVLKQAVLNGAFDDTPETLALFADGLWPIAKMDPSFITEVTVTIPGGNAAGQAGILNSNPVELIATPGAGKFLLVESAEWFKAAGTAYDAVAGGDNLVLVYTGATTPLTPTGVSTGFADQAGAEYRYVGQAQPPVFEPAENTGISAYCQGSDWYGAAGDCAVKARIRYRVVTSLT